MPDAQLVATILWRLTLTRFRDFVREPEAVFWVLVFPSLLAAVLGVAFRGGPGQTPMVAATTPALAASLAAAPQLAAQMLSPPEAEALLRAGRVALVVEQGPDGVVYRYDASNDTARVARILADRAIQHSAGQTDPVAARDESHVAPGSRYIDFLAPGLLGMTLMSSAVWGVGYPVSDARRRNLMKRLIVTPMPRSLYLVSFVVHALLLMAVEASVILAFCGFAFGVPLRGSALTLAAVCATTSLAFCGLGLLLAARVRTVEGASGLMNATMTPMLILSGVFFPAQKFPDWSRPIIDALPLTSAVDALRSVMLEGASLWTCWRDLAALAGWGVGCFSLAVWLFRWR